MFDVAQVARALTTDTRGDIADLTRVRHAMEQAQPSVIFHLAAQPLVRESYRDPVGTLATNVLGTAHVLEAARYIRSVQAIVVVTTDKVYASKEQVHPYRETDELGGYDPYSASKAAAELVAAGYRASFFSYTKDDHPAQLATARAGNAIGGGDWADERLVPDCLRAFEKQETVLLRQPRSIRPWQHVLDPLSGYLLLAERLLEPGASFYSTAWNFGPDTMGDATVGQVAQELARIWSGSATVRIVHEDNPLPETKLLRLDTTQARVELGWRPRWSLSQALQATVDWQQEWLSGEDMHYKTLEQVEDYEKAESTLWR